MKTTTKKRIALVIATALLMTSTQYSVFGTQTDKVTIQLADANVNVPEEPATGNSPETEVSTEETSTPEVSTPETSTDEISTQEPSTQEPTTGQSVTTESTTQAPTTKTPTTAAPETTTQAGKKAWGKSNDKFYNDKLKVIPGAVKKGVDVSHWQGKIDWEKVSKSDVDYAIIRCGFGNNNVNQDDKYFAQNIAGCEKYNIPYGIYIYSYAQNVSDAKSEAEHVLRLIKSTGAKPEYPIYIDFEDASQNNLTAKKLGNIATAFFNKTIAAGYKAGVYANLNWWNNKLTDSRFSKWTRWVAQYNSVCAYSGRYEMWQSTSTGKVSGISGNADLNFELEHNCSSDGHIYSQWVTTKSATISRKGSRTRICSVCGKVQKNAIAKLKTTGKLNKTKITLKYKQKYKKLKVLNLAKGDGIKSYKSSNKKIVTVSKKGVITAKKKKGKATVTVTLKSGKKLKFKVTVKKK